MQKPAPIAGFYLFCIYMPDEKILNKIRHYCKYQERSQQEVRSKLISLKVYGKALEEIMSKLIEENFLNEERFAKMYAGGKFRMLKWGRVKIKKGLRAKKISDYCIRKAMHEITSEEYEKALTELIAASLKKYQSENKFEMKQKTAYFLIAKGYEPELVWKGLNRDNE